LFFGNRSRPRAPPQEPPTGGINVLHGRAPPGLEGSSWSSLGRQLGYIVVLAVIAALLYTIVPALRRMSGI
jgi:hypothetical protein